ncbi:MAG: HDOD domain-containing protein, partial [Gammaproteobacteria bacterium]|nr:HDOD domain-containing protein [Gammaproteobacteria bacterium]
QLAAAGTELIALGATDPRALYLLSGEVAVRAADGRNYNVTANSAKAKQPISHLLPHRYSVTALTPVTCFWVLGPVIDNLLERHSRVGESTESLFVQPATLSNPLFQAIHRDLDHDRLAVPALPDIVLRYRNIVNSDADVRRIKALIQTDPALTALLMKVANSAVYRASKSIGTIEEAIVRIGLKALQNFVIGFAMRKLFKTRSPHIKKQMEHLWVHSTEVAAISYVLAKKIGKFNPDHAMLLGLLHDVGTLPVLSYAENFPEIASDEHELVATIRELHGDVGRLVMTKWNFPGDFTQVAQEADDWQRDHTGDADYCDLVLVAQLLSFMGKQIGHDTPSFDVRVLPELPTLPAYRKLGLGELSPESSISILHNAKEEIAEAMHLVAM